MKIKIDLNTDNAAFQDNKESEMMTVLRIAIRKIVRGEKDGNVMDSNGNTVGNFNVKE